MDDKYLLRSKNARFKIIDDEVLILKNNSLYELNHSAAKIWRLAGGTKTIKQIISNISCGSGINKRTIRQDTLNFIRSALRAGILILSESEKC